MPTTRPAATAPYDRGTQLILARCAVRGRLPQGSDLSPRSAVLPIRRAKRAEPFSQSAVLSFELLALRAQFFELC
jgi:hypothetical protein